MMTIRIESYQFEDDGVFPNGRYPALIYRGVLEREADRARAFEGLFARNGWTSAWRDGLFTFHHYHSSAHEVLGIHSGTVRVALGGPGRGGRLIELRAGDVVVVPAGLAHKNDRQSSDFGTVGAYPRGTFYDMMYGKKGERPTADRNIDRVPLPSIDPVEGRSGSLPRLWARANRG
jgi:uncharacterized protein YjlB